MLRIDNFTATRLLSLNVRTENHGEGLARAIDLKCQMDAPNTFLQQLAPELLAMLFMPVEQPEPQAKLDGVAETLPLLRSHAIKWPLDLEGDYAGYQLTVDRGLGGTSNMVLQEAKLNKLRLTCLEGGTVQLQYRLQVSGVGDEVIGRLSSYIKADMFVALLPPQIKQEAKQEAIDGTVGHPGAKAAEADDKPAPTGHEAGDTLAANEAAGLNKPGSEVPKPKPSRKKAKQPSLAVVD
jgi:hypothetical protein